jgi:hypothetical protein
MALLDKLMRRAPAKKGDDIHDDDEKAPTPPISKTSTDDGGNGIKILDYEGNDSNEKVEATLEEPFMKNGEPVITTGLDVSRYVVDIRDDEDPALTFRSLTIGTVFAGLGAALCQVLSLS